MALPRDEELHNPSNTAITRPVDRHNPPHQMNVYEVANTERLDVGSSPRLRVIYGHDRQTSEAPNLNASPGAMNAVEERVVDERRSEVS